MTQSSQIKSIVALLCSLGAMIYGLCVFIYQTKQSQQDIADLKISFEEMCEKNAAIHKEIENRVNQNEKNFQMNSAKLDISLIEIRADLQFIKGHLIKKGLDK